MWRSMAICAYAVGAALLHSTVVAQPARAAPAVTPPTAASQPANHGKSAPFAVVGDTMISGAEFDAAFQVAQRNKFYHRKVPEAEVNQLRREVGDDLINRVLLSAEAKRLNLGPDPQRVQAQLDEYEKRYASSPSWPRMKAEALPALTAELERRSVLQKLEADVRAVPPPTEEALHAFYKGNPQMFTEPEQVRISVILLKVDPSAPREAWEGARKEAAAIRSRIERGADFAELARLHSADASAASGGDMGYLHRGMLPEAVEARLSKMSLKELSEPVTVLEGVALLRFEDRKEEKLRDFESVRPRASQMWQRLESDRRWSEFLANLRSKARVEIVDAARYPAVTATSQ